MLLEQRFQAIGLTRDADKYWFVVQNLGPQLIDEISDQMVAFPLGSQYESVKAMLVKKFGETNDQKLERLFSGCSLGQLLPSELLSKMKALATGQLSPELVLRLWWKRLPEHIAIATDALVSSGCEKEAVEQADRLILLRRKSGLVDEVSPAPNQCFDIAQLLPRIEALESRRSRAGRSSDRSRGSSRSRSSSSARSSGLCFYHRVYKLKALKCRKPCSWVDRTPKQDGDSSARTSSSGEQ